MKGNREREIDAYKVAIGRGIDQQSTRRGRSGKGRSGKTIYDGCVDMDIPGAFLVDESGRGLLELERELEDTAEAKLLEDPPL